MTRGLLLGAAFALFFCGGASAEIAFIPYQIENPSAEFPESTGGEYSRLLSVAALVVKEGIEVSSPREIELDLERMKLSPQELITGEDLDLLGRTRGVDYFLLGSLSRRGGIYRSRSVLYSVREGKILSRFRAEGEDRVKLAEKEIRESLGMYRDRAPRRDAVAGRGEMDLLFLVDMSYRVNREWKQVTGGIIALSSRLIDEARMDTRVYIVPFSDRSGYPSASVSVNSITALRDELARLKPAGGARPESFVASLRYAVGSVRWRPSARKSMVVISNSSVAARGVDQYAIMARKKGIVIDTFSLGQTPGELSEAMERIAAAGSGSHRHVAYRQRLFNASGEPVDVYMENGRLFKSNYPHPEWRKGLYDISMPRRHQGKPKDFMEEVLFDEKSVPVNPYTIPEAYGRITMERIINQEGLESNIDVLLGLVADRETGGRRGAPVSAGKALLSDGKISFWVNAPDGEWMELFKQRLKSGHYFLMGVVVVKDTGSPYGVTLMPMIRPVGPDYVPRILRADLGDIVRRDEYFRTRGLWRPPVWFVNVKVESAEGRSGRRDIRGK